MNDADTIQERLTNAELRPKMNPVQRILVADDEEMLRRLVADGIARCGYNVDAAEDGEIAWAALNTKRYDLLITDNSMPRVTGIALVKMLRDHAMAIPVIMATGVHPTEDLERYPHLGITAILIKPYAIKDLMETVKKILPGADSTAAELQLQLFSDTKNICLPMAIRASEDAEKLLPEEPLLRL
jgi:DNA-binding response OmpR family regulator